MGKIHGMTEVKGVSLLERYLDAADEIAAHVKRVKEEMRDGLYELRSEFPVFRRFDVSTKNNGRFIVILRIKSRSDFESGCSDRETRIYMHCQYCPENGREPCEAVMMPLPIPHNEKTAGIFYGKGVTDDEFLCHSSERVLGIGKHQVMADRWSFAIGREKKGNIVVFDRYFKFNDQPYKMFTDKKAYLIVMTGISERYRWGLPSNPLAVLATDVILLLRKEAVWNEEVKVRTEYMTECLELCLKVHPEMTRHFPDWQARIPSTPEGWLEYAEEIRGLSYDLGTVEEPMEGKGWYTQPRPENAGTGMPPITILQERYNDKLYQERYAEWMKMNIVVLTQKGDEND